MICPPERENQVTMAVLCGRDQATSTDQPRKEERGANTSLPPERETRGSNTDPPPGREDRGTMGDMTSPAWSPPSDELSVRLAALEGAVQSRMTALEEVVGRLDRRVVAPPLGNKGSEDRGVASPPHGKIEGEGISPASRDLDPGDGKKSP